MNFQKLNEKLIHHQKIIKNNYEKFNLNLLIKISVHLNLLKCDIKINSVNRRYYLSKEAFRTNRQFNYFLI